jgi:tyrosine-protein phosphatase YwqE
MKKAEDNLTESQPENFPIETPETEITKKQILEKTAKEYYNAGKDELNKNRYNFAIVLFFKSLTSLTDLYILQQTGNTPSSHTERFKITQENFQDVYDLLDKDFPFYQNTYIQLMTK